MDQKPPQFWLRIQCPQCGSRYKAERAKVPAVGATAQCKKCGAKLLLIDESAYTQVRVPETDQCPKCGFTQKEGEFCYQCGSRIRILAPQKKDSETSVDLPVGLVQIKIEYKNTFFLMSATKPVIEIDKEMYMRSWGTHQFQLPPGEYSLRIYCHLLGQTLCEQSIQISVAKDDYVELLYEVTSLKQARLQVIRKESQAAWRTLIHTNIQPDEDPFYLKPFPVIVMLVTLFPIGAWLLWKSKHFPESYKLMIIILGLAGFLWVVFNLIPAAS
jgi:predicted Zn finger-like uncharacterized protein